MPTVVVATMPPLDLEIDVFRPADGTVANYESPTTKPMPTAKTTPMATCSLVNTSVSMRS